MRKKNLILSAMCFISMTVSAHPFHQENSTLYDQNAFNQEQMLMPLNPTYLKNVHEAANWGRNWFIEIKGGASAFLGSPIGCGDVFDRITPALRVGVGKWFTPAIGGRVGFQGFKFKNAEFKTMDYQFIHADFMYNVTSAIRQNENGIPLWDVIPYFGVGMIRNADWAEYSSQASGSSGSHPFAFSYGIEARYRLNDRMHLVAEVSGMTTAKNFDAIGCSTKFGDHSITTSIGLSFTLGKTGWKRVIDATPYIEENLYLKDYISYIKDENVRLQKKASGDTDVKVTYPKNNYSGLNSLRARLALASVDTNESNNNDNNDDGNDGEDGDGRSNSTQHYRADSIMYNNPRKIIVGVPIYFFFQLNTDVLVDKSQLVNLDDIAKIAKKQNLNIQISGAADSATGTQSLNLDLGKRRATYIANALIGRGIDGSQIQIHNFGGIDKYEDNEANRFTIVMLTK